MQDPKDKSKGSRLKQKYHATEGEFELSRFRPVVQMILEVWSSPPKVILLADYTGLAL
jgi:hypothetical protein